VEASGVIPERWPRGGSSLLAWQFGFGVVTTLILRLRSMCSLRRTLLAATAVGRIRRQAWRVLRLAYPNPTRGFWWRKIHRHCLGWRSPSRCGMRMGRVRWSLGACSSVTSTLFQRAGERGSAGLLLDAVVAEALRHNYWRVCLWTHEDNDRSHRLYRSHGFRPTGRVADGEGEWVTDLSRVQPGESP
jgi:GNAT superfamily N-acetyltransferase